MQPHPYQTKRMGGSSTARKNLIGFTNNQRGELTLLFEVSLYFNTPSAIVEPFTSKDSFNLPENRISSKIPIHKKKSSPVSCAYRKTPFTLYSLLYYFFSANQAASAFASSPCTKPGGIFPLPFSMISKISSSE